MNVDPNSVGTNSDAIRYIRSKEGNLGFHYFEKKKE
jgi:hypothetical protein